MQRFLCTTVYHHVFLLSSCPLPLNGTILLVLFHPQEATVVGAIWLDVFSRAVEDRTDGAGLTKLSDGFAFVPLRDLVHPVGGSPVAAYLHDDPELFRNDRLDNDEKA
jgi:hypothetical protein